MQIQSISSLHPKKLGETSWLSGAETNGANNLLETSWWLQVTRTAGLRLRSVLGGYKLRGQPDFDYAQSSVATSYEHRNIVISF
jgi:hypothetical protein